MKSYNKILFLGSTGFIGSELINSSLFQSYQFLLPVRNNACINKIITNKIYIDIKELSKEHINECQIIFYMLDDIALLKQSIDNINDYFGLKYLEFIVNSMKGNQHIVFLSSRMVYNKESIIPVKETSTLLERDVYSAMKIRQEELIINYAKKNNFNYNILRATNVYTTNKESNAKNIVNIFIKSILTESSLSIYGTGNQLRDYVNVNYLINIIYYLTENSKVNNIFNVGSNVGHTINQIVECMQKNITKELIIKKINMNIDESAFVADCTNIQKIISYKYDLYEDINMLLRDIVVK